MPLVLISPGIIIIKPNNFTRTVRNIKMIIIIILVTAAPIEKPSTTGSHVPE